MRAPLLPTLPAEGLGHHEVDRDAAARTPAAGLGMLEISVKAGALHGLVQKRRVAEYSWVDSEIAVLGRLGERDGGVAGVQVDRLRPDQDQCVTLLDEGLKRVEQGRSRRDEEVSVASRAHGRPSNQVGRWPRSGCGRGR